MANRVNVNINVNDMSRAGLRSLRQSLNRMQQDARRAGGNIRFNVRIPDDAARRDMRRIQNALRGSPVTITTRLDPPTPPPMTLRRRIQRSLGRAVTVPVRLTSRGLRGTVGGPLRSLRGLVSGTLQDGVGQGLIQGFKAGGPVGAAVLAAIIISTLSVIGAALSGLIVTALGAAFVGIGAASAFQSEEVRKQWSETLASLKENFASVGEPLIPVLNTALERLEEMGDKAAPRLKQALADTAGSTDQFFQKILDGFGSFADSSFDRIMEAWGVFAPVFGEQWDEFMRELGDAFGDMADLVKEHPTEIAMALEVVFEAIELLIRTITFFGEVWVRIMQGALDATAFVIKVMANLGIVSVNSTTMMFEGIANVIGLIPGMGDKMEGAKQAMRAWRDKTVGDLQGMKAKADEFSGALDRANKERKLKADISNWEAKLKAARADLKRTTDQKAKAKVKADIENLKSNLASARRQLDALNGKVVTTYVDTWQRNRGYAGNSVTGGRAHGGIIPAARSGGVRGNLTLVGEAGPELVQLPTGSRVRTAGDTRRVLGDGGSGGGAAFVFKSSGRRVDDLLLEILREAVHQRGGDPVAVLGG